MEQLSTERAVRIFLFVKKVSNKCIFKGEVTLCAEPYKAPRHDNPSRSVWIFPLKAKTVNEETTRARYEAAEQRALDESLSDLYQKVKGKADSMQPQQSNKEYTSIRKYYERNPDIAAFAKLCAQGVCDLCESPAPFADKNGRPYLESHHIVWLSKGGPDEVGNVVALCPNCHRKMHLVNDSADVAKLIERAKHHLATI